MMITRRNFITALGLLAAAGTAAAALSIATDILPLFDGTVPEKDSRLQELLEHPETIDHAEAAMGSVQPMMFFSDKGTNRMTLSPYQLQRVLAVLRRGCSGQLQRQAAFYQPVIRNYRAIHSGLTPEIAVVAFFAKEGTSPSWAMDKAYDFDLQWDEESQTEQQTNVSSQKMLCIGFPTTLFWQQEEQYIALFPDRYFEQDFTGVNLTGSRDFIIVGSGYMEISFPQRNAMDFGDEITQWLGETVDTDSLCRELFDAVEGQCPEETNWANGVITFMDRPFYADTGTDLAKITPYARNGVRACWRSTENNNLYAIWKTADGAIHLLGPTPFALDKQDDAGCRLFPHPLAVYRLAESGVASSSER